jgi:tetratricopeptide (TPR) repeat protein
MEESFGEEADEEDLFGESDLPDFSGGEDLEEETGKEGAFPEFEEGEEELAAPEESGGAKEEGGLEELELPEDEFENGEFEIDEFNLGDLGEEFGVLEETAEKEEIGLQAGEGEEELEEEEVSLDLTDEQFKALGETLLTLPRNLKLIVEEQIGEKRLAGEALVNLVNCLVERKSPKEIAQVASKIIGRKIKIPSQYEKKTGAAFEAEKDSFAYRFRYRILPLLRTIVLSMIAVGILIFTAYRYAYQPLYALYLYNQGFEQLEEREYPAAHTYFERALDQWVMRKQFFRYAAEYEEQKQYTLAEEKYDQLLFHFPYDREGTLAYGRLELEKLSNYEKAAAILRDYLTQEPKEYDVMLLLGDTYLEWGREDPSMYEQARYNYAVLMENYGVADELLFRMLKYFVRTDNFDEVMSLNRYYKERPEVEVDPAAFAEMAGYFLDKGRVEDVRDILFRARRVDEKLPEIHYQLARYFLRIEEYHEEEKALRNTLSLMQNISPLTSDRIEMKVDTFRRYGERLYARKNYLEARSSYIQGIELYEQSLARKLIAAKPELGKIYADLADIFYYQGGEFSEAAALYEKAERNLYDSKEMKYKQGYISYLNQDYRTAMMRFQKAAGAFSKNPNIIYSTANTLFHRGDYQAAQAYFEHLVEIFERDIERERPLLIDQRRDHRALVENIMMATNNLGVTYYRLYRKTGLAEYYSRAMVQFAESSRYFDRLTRNPVTLARTGLSNLAFLNQRKLLFPEGDYDLQIYNSLPIDSLVPELGS